MSRWEFSSSSPDQPDRPEPRDNTRRAASDKPWEPEPGARHEAYVQDRIYRAEMALEMLCELVPPADSVNQSADDPRRPYAAGIPQMMRDWTQHQRDWPTSRRAGLGSDETTGGQADRPALSPERHAEATDAIGKVRETEPPVSDAMQAIEQYNSAGARLVGFDHRLKGDNRLIEKAAEWLGNRPDMTPTEAVQRIPDTIRYTFCIDHDSYAGAYKELKARLEVQGYQMYESRNFWGDPEYKGINTRWVTPEGGRFEVQFHTPQSFHAKEHMTHQAYERLRDTRTSKAEMRELHAFQRSVTARIPMPDGAIDIPGYEKEGF